MSAQLAMAGDDWLSDRDRKAQARAENEALRKDAERYRWLVKNSTYCPANTTPILAPVANRIWYHATIDTVNDSLDSVIDAALAAGGE